jgi:hypothetical protein
VCNLKQLARRVPVLSVYRVNHRARIGPVAVGFLSDALHARHGADSLRLALLVVPVYLWSAYHFEAAARTISADLQGATGWLSST